MRFCQACIYCTTINVSIQASTVCMHVLSSVRCNGEGSVMSAYKLSSSREIQEFLDPMISELRHVTAPLFKVSSSS